MILFGSIAYLLSPLRKGAGSEAPARGEPGTRRGLIGVAGRSGLGMPTPGQIEPCNPHAAEMPTVEPETLRTPPAVDRSYQFCATVVRNAR